MKPTQLPQALKEVRKAAGLSMKELAARLGYSDRWTDHVESGRRGISIEDLERFAHACGRRLVLDVVAPGQEPVILSPPERAILALLREADDDQREAIRRFAELLPGAREGAAGAALSVLANLQRAPRATGGQRATGTPEE